MIRVVCLILFPALLAHCYNIEENVVSVKLGEPGSLFGLSVAQHHLVKNADSINNAVLLVGAPTARASSFHSSDSVKPGALFSCGVSKNESDCQSIRVDDTVNSLPRNNSNQWLGVTVKSQKPGGLVAVCAHRFALKGGTASRGIIWKAEVGRCYMLTSYLQPVSSLSEYAPCIGELDPDGSYSQAYHGYCQAGTSVAFAQNKEEEFIIGMPGLFHWTGGIKSFELSIGAFFALTLWSKDDKTKDDIKQNSYNGFSSATGNISNSPYVDFVTGAPRANDTGVVVIYEKESLTASKKLRISEIIHGEILASSFGYDVAVADITGDGLDDLIIGAPQYYDRENKSGGAVYIYVNKGLQKIGPKATHILKGDLDSSFGNSISVLGDINKDGINDIAVGAPGADGGVGEVFIYHGSSDATVGISKTASQILKGIVLNKTLPINVTGFGYSLSGGLDMDFNGYPDLAIGSLSDFAALYRTRPIVNVTASLIPSLTKVNINPKKNPNTEDVFDPSSNKTQKLVTFSVDVCMIYTALPSTFDEFVDMSYTVKLDTVRLDNDLRPRATFVPFDYEHGIKTDVMKLFRQSRHQKKCVALPIYLDNDMQDKLSPFVMSLSYDTLNKNALAAESKTELLSLNQYPVLNKDIFNHTSTQVNISKNCGQDEICKSNLQMDAEYVVLLSGSKAWSPLKQGEEGIPELLVGTQKAIGVKINIGNADPGEDAHQAKLKIHLPDFLNYIGLADVIAKAATARCDTLNATVVECELGNPFRTESGLSLIVKLGNDERLYEVRQFQLQMELSTSSTQALLGLVSYPASVRVQVALVIDGYSSNDQIPFGGKVIGESAIEKSSDAGSLVQQGYEVMNIGTTEINEVYVNISWPYAIANGKWLFYLLSADVSGATSEKAKCVDNHFNPLSLIVDSKAKGLSSERRRRREVSSDGSLPADLTSPVIRPRSSHKLLKCPESAHCFHFTCMLGTLLPQKKVDIRLKAVAWNSTFIEEYFGVAEVQVLSNAHVTVNISNAKFSDLSVLESEVSTSMLSETVIAPKEQVKLWIVAVATLAGVILLVIIVLLLWRCGFFKRRRDYGDYHKAKKHRQASQKADETTDRMLY